MIQSFRDLEVYSESYDLSILVNREVVKLPRFEINDLGSQIRRCSKSPPANIAEGWGKRLSEKEMKRHLNIALGSCNEMEVHLSTAKDLGYLRKDFCEEVILRYRRLGGKLNRLRDKWKSY